MRHDKGNHTLNDMGEAGIIQQIQGQGTTGPASHVTKGIGDDCAVLEADGASALLVTTDTLIEGIHFTNQTLSPEALGWKSLAVNVSDIAAMGGTPRTAFLSLGLKPETKPAFLDAFLVGFRAFSEKTGVVLAGGDTVESPSCTVVTVTLLGDCPRECVVYRSGAEVGDHIWVTGRLGDAAGGLFLLSNKARPTPVEYASLILAHQKPMPPFELGKALGAGGLAHAMIDVSDGVAKDLGHICEQSGVGALLQGASLPMSDPLKRLADQVAQSPLRWALQGGEDYELLFTASPVEEPRIRSLNAKASDRRATRIGKIIEDSGIWLEAPGGRSRLESPGFLHFIK
ncbi:MAG: thiamine-phosphate kinase [Thermodesulfobacteriota bacterium]|nr:thiamine-phosphate kinase [Thermodesulfobacteriota bacterium]